MTKSSPRPPAAIEFAANALKNLREIETYSVAQWGQRVADAYLNDIQAAVDRIRLNPSLLRLEPGISKAFRFYRVRKHCLICQVFDKVIIVLAVIHTAMDLRSRLTELEPTLIAEAKMLAEEYERSQQV